MKYFVQQDEFWPFRELVRCGEGRGEGVEISDEEKKDYDAMCIQFYKWQRKLTELEKQ